MGKKRIERKIARFTPKIENRLVTAARRTDGTKKLQTENCEVDKSLEIDLRLPQVGKVKEDNGDVRLQLQRNTAFDWRRPMRKFTFSRIQTWSILLQTDLEIRLFWNSDMAHFHSQRFANPLFLKSRLQEEIQTSGKVNLQTCVGENGPCLQIHVSLEMGHISHRIRSGHSLFLESGHVPRAPTQICKSTFDWNPDMFNLRFHPHRSAIPLVRASGRVPYPSRQIWKWQLSHDELLFIEKELKRKKDFFSLILSKFFSLNFLKF